MTKDKFNKLLQRFRNKIHTAVQYDEHPHPTHAKLNRVWSEVTEAELELKTFVESLLTEREGWVLVPNAVVDELNRIANTVCDLQQNLHRQDSDAVMQWNNSKLTLGTLRIIRRIAAAPRR